MYNYNTLRVFDSYGILFKVLESDKQNAKK